VAAAKVADTRESFAERVPLTEGGAGEEHRRADGAPRSLRTGPDRGVESPESGSILEGDRQMRARASLRSAFAISSSESSERGGVSSPSTWPLQAGRSLPADGLLHALRMKPT